MSFSADLGRFRSKAMDSIDQARQAIILELFSSIILDTPVDTGRARGNWQTDIGNPIKEAIDRIDQGGEAAIRQAQAKIASSGMADSLFMSNNLPYIEPLENGSSRQAPQGMVKRNFARVKQIVRRNT